METDCSVAEVMTSEVHSLKPETTIAECAKLMAEKKVGSFPVLDQGFLIGIITEQDLARKALAESMNPEETSVSQIMSRTVKTISPEKDIQEAIEFMGEHNIKHLPVLTGEKLEGIITFKDIIKIEPALIEHISFKNS